MLRQTQMVEYQKKMWGDEGETLLIKPTEDKTVIGSSPKAVEQKCLIFEKRRVVESDERIPYTVRSELFLVSRKQIWRELGSS